MSLFAVSCSKLMAPNFTSISYDEDGNEIITNVSQTHIVTQGSWSDSTSLLYIHLQGQANCYYQGKVEEHPKWVVIMNTCGGLK